MKKFSKDEILFMLHDLDIPESLKMLAHNDVDISTLYYSFLYRLAWFGKPELALELGTYKGFGSGALRLGNSLGRVISVDVEDFASNHPDRVVPGVEYWNCDSCWPEEDLRDIGILFIDTIHDGVQPKKEFDFYIDRMHKDGIILFDDISLNDEMKAFWASFHPKGIKIELPLHGEPGFGLVLLNQEAQEA